MFARVQVYQLPKIIGADRNRAAQARREEKQRKDLEQQQEASARQLAISNHINTLSAEMKASKDPAVAARIKLTNWRFFNSLWH